MPLTQALAIELAEALSTMDEFPRFRGAIHATAEDLIWLLANVEDETAAVRASALVSRIRQSWPVWPGTAAMVECYERVFLGKKEAAPANAALDYGARPAVDCNECHDVGFLQMGGQYQWCRCAGGANLRRQFPDWLATWNRAPEGLRPAPLTPAPPPVKWDETAREGKGGWVPV